MVIGFLILFFGPGIALGLWLGLRATDRERLRRGALLAWGGTALWGLAVWTTLFVFAPAPDARAMPSEALEAVPRIVAVAAVNALPFFVAGWLIARRRAHRRARA